MYQGVRLVTGLITKHTPTPVDADGVAGLAAALASFPVNFLRTRLPL